MDRVGTGPKHFQASVVLHEKIIIFNPNWRGAAIKKTIKKTAVTGRVIDRIL